MTFDLTHVLMIGAGVVLAVLAIRLVPAWRAKVAGQSAPVAKPAPKPTAAVQVKAAPIATDPRVDAYMASMRPKVEAAFRAADEQAALAVHAQVSAQLAAVAAPKP